jgi:hypothetical protein
VNSFYETLTDAIKDMASHGYDSDERVTSWRDRLREAAEASWSSARHAEGTARAALGGVYERLITRFGILKKQPGMHRWQIERVKPQLRGELDRRILAAASLIKLNRDEAVAKTLRRSYVERRLATDQGHKLIASLNKVVAEGNGAIAVRWRSIWRQAGYDYREDHKERDEKIYLLRNSWAVTEGLVQPNENGYIEDIDQFGEAPYCSCFGVYIFALGKVPQDMLTEKGAERLAEARKAVRGTS